MSKENLPLISVWDVEEISVTEYNKTVVGLVKKKYSDLRQKSKGP